MSHEELSLKRCGEEEEDEEEEEEEKQSLLFFLDGNTFSKLRRSLSRESIGWNYHHLSISMDQKSCRHLENLPQ